MEEKKLTHAQESIICAAEKKQADVDFIDHLEDGDYSDSPSHVEHTDS